ncbi:GNAT family N-acetyltransferase [Peribacillus sp. NPDC096540]
MDYYKEYWGSVSNFSENGFGYWILHKGKVVSECYFNFFFTTILRN